MKKIVRISILLLISLIQFKIVIAQSATQDSIVRERLQCIQTMLNKSKPNANLWWYGWLAAYSAATVGQGIVYFISEDKSLKQDMALGAATTLLGAAGQLITPMVPGYAPDRLAGYPENTSAERITKLSVAEELLKNSSKREFDGRSWKTHAISGVVNLSSGMITWLGFKRTVWAGVGNFALNTLISEAQIWSQPTRSIRDYKEYNKKYKPGTTFYYLKYKLKWFATAYPGGIIVRLSF